MGKGFHGRGMKKVLQKCETWSPGGGIERNVAKYHVSRNWFISATLHKRYNSCEKQLSKISDGYHWQLLQIIFERTL
jgi:hypothetical protein